MNDRKHDIRRATVEDAEEIAHVATFVQRLHYEQYPDRFQQPNAEKMTPYFREQINREDVEVLVANDQGAITGYAIAVIQDKGENPFKKASRVVELDQLAVAEDQQWKGYGTALIEAVIAFSAQVEAEELKLTVWSFNQRAIELYGDKGFSTTLLTMNRPVTTN